MNANYVMIQLNIGDVVRITTEHAVGVIGKVLDINIAHNGLTIEEVKEPLMAEQIENPVAYDKAIFSITDIKYIFVLDLTKPKNENGSNDSKSKV